MRFKPFDFYPEHNYVFYLGIEGRLGVRKKAHSRKSNPSVFIGRGYPIKIADTAVHKERLKLEDIAVDDKLRLGHWLTIGSTGTGKTRLLELVVEHDILEGYNVAVFDPKPDKDLFARIVYAAERAGRLRDLIVVRPDRPEISARVNPFAFYSVPEELVQHVMAGIPPSTEEFFRNVAYEVSTVVILGKWLLRKYLNSNEPFTVEDLRSHISREGIGRIWDQLRDMSTGGGFRDPSLNRYLEIIQACMADLVQSPQDYFAKVTSTLRTTLTAMVVGSTGDILGVADENIFVKRLLNGDRIILLIQSPAMVMRQSAFILMRAILSMFQSFTGAIYLENVGKYAGKLDPPLYIHVDELSEALYWDFVNLLNKSRGAGLGIHGLSQSISDLFSKVGENVGETLIDNFNIQLFMRVNNPGTSQFISRKAGFVHRFTRIMSRGEFTTREVREPLVKETEIMELPDRHFLLFTKQEGKPAIWRGEVKFVKNVPLTVELD